MKVWNEDATSETLRIEGHMAEITCAAWSHNEEWIASGDEAGSVRIWNATSGEQLALLSHDDEVSSLAWSPDDQSLAVTAEESLALWDLTSMDQPTH